MRLLVSFLFIALLVHSVSCWWDKEKEKEDDHKRVKVNAFSAVINDLAGVFRQVNIAGDPIFKLVSGSGDLGMRQINTVGSAIYKPSLFGSAVSGLGNIAWFGAVGMEAYNVAEAVKKDREEGLGSYANTVHASGKAVGGFTGATYGAATGAAMLSFIPGVGTIVGGIAGGLIGAYTGQQVGEAAATVAVGGKSKY